jgi:hypothetical protein
MPHKSPLMFELLFRNYNACSKFIFCYDMKEVAHFDTLDLHHIS